MTKSKYQKLLLGLNKSRREMATGRGKILKSLNDLRKNRLAQKCGPV